MQNMSGIGFLARFLADLQSSFDAEILDARDDLDGGVVVDVRVDAGRAMKLQRTLVRERAAVSFGATRATIARTQALRDQTQQLIGQIRVTKASSRTLLADTREEFSFLRRSVQGARDSQTLAD